MLALPSSCVWILLVTPFKYQNSVLEILPSEIEVAGIAVILVERYVVSQEIVCFSAFQDQVAEIGITSVDTILEWASNSYILL